LVAIELLWALVLLAVGTFVTTAVTILTKKLFLKKFNLNSEAYAFKKKKPLLSFRVLMIR